MALTTNYRTFFRVSVHYRPLREVLLFKQIHKMENPKSFKNDERKSFNLFLDWEKNIKKMSTEEKAMFLDMLYDAYNYRQIKEVPEDYLVLSIVWDSVSSLIERNLAYDIKRGFIESTDFLNPSNEQSQDSLQTVSKQSSNNNETTKTNTSTHTETATKTSTDTETITKTLLKQEPIRYPDDKLRVMNPRALNNAELFRRSQLRNNH